MASKTYRNSFFPALFSILAVMFFAGANGASAELSKEAAVEKAKMMVKELGGGLKKELGGAMKAGGPTNAIPVCKSVAQTRAKEVSDKHGAMIHRVSLKLRNPANKPDDFERSSLEAMEADHHKGALKPAYAKVVTIDGKKNLRFMKPIVTNGICLNCHGDPGSLDKKVVQTLAREYPQDKATGYGTDMVRGAFSVVVPME